jgi:hypothetical protein
MNFQDKKLMKDKAFNCDSPVLPIIPMPAGSGFPAGHYLYPMADGMMKQPE